MKKTSLAFFIFSVILFSSCDPTYNIDFEVDNSSHHRLEIRHKFFTSDSIITNIISGHTKLVLYNEFGIGISTRGMLRDMESLPFELFEIVVLDMVDYQKDEMDIENWNKEFPGKKSGLGTLKLRLLQYEFE